MSAPARGGIRIDAIVAGVVVLLHLICISQYGWFRDELYFIACSKHLAWGYVDQPPMIAFLIWIERHLFGDSLFALRIFAVLGHAGLVVMTGSLVRRFGGTRSAMALACTAVALAPIYLSLGHIMTMNIFEPLFWMGCVLVALAIFDGASEKLWLLFGVLAGLGLENKQSTAFFGAMVVVGLLLTKRRNVFARPWIWLGGVVAFLIALPNAIWQWQHQWPMLELLHNIAQSGKNAPVTPLSFFAGNAILMNPITVPLWIAGAVWLLAKPRFRWLGVAFVALFVFFIVMKGKIYYFSPMMPVALAAGSIAIDSVWRRRLGAVYIAVIVATGAIILPLAIPILPVETFIRYKRLFPIGAPKTESHDMGPLPQLYADMFGWPEMTAVVARAYNSLSPADRAKCGIFGQNYGQAGAIDFFGPRYGLPHAISGHQNYWFWGPDGYDGSVLIVMDDDKETLEKIFDHVEEVGVVDHPYAMPYERHKPVHLCRGLKIPMRELWPNVKKWI
ncbi:MAG TPA: glycosyltransferase family 39 protein [Thermoanaerobaculia bacterium]